MYLQERAERGVHAQHLRPCPAVQALLVATKAGHHFFDDGDFDDEDFLFF